MKKRFKYRSQFKNVLTQLGVVDKTVLDQDVNKVVNRYFNVLVNPQRRVLKSLLSLSLEEQRANLAALEAQLSVKNQLRSEDNDLLEKS